MEHGPGCPAHVKPPACVRRLPRAAHGHVKGHAPQARPARRGCDGRRASPPARARLNLGKSGRPQGGGGRRSVKAGASDKRGARSQLGELSLASGSSATRRAAARPVLPCVRLRCSRLLLVGGISSFYTLALVWVSCRVRRLAGRSCDGWGSFCFCASQMDGQGPPRPHPMAREHEVGRRLVTLLGPEVMR